MKYPPGFYYQLLKLHLGQNGFRWTFYFCVNYLISRFSAFAQKKMTALEERHGIPGRNSKAENKLKWNCFSWEKSGEEWTSDPEWKESLVREVMHKHFCDGKDILEIGPGGGRWTAHLQKIAKKLTIIDISDVCIELCRKRFTGCDNMCFHVNDGTSLSMIKDNSVDYIWSFDVFVHIQPDDIELYIKEFKRVLRSGGIGIVHHAGSGSDYGGWRSKMTGELFRNILKKHELSLVFQFDQWGDKPEFNVSHFRDVITVFKV